MLFPELITLEGNQAVVNYEFLQFNLPLFVVYKSLPISGMLAYPFKLS